MVKVQECEDLRGALAAVGSAGGWATGFGESVARAVVIEARSRLRGAALRASARFGVGVDEAWWGLTVAAWEYVVCERAVLAAGAGPVWPLVCRVAIRVQTRRDLADKSCGGKYRSDVAGGGMVLPLRGEDFVVLEPVLTPVEQLRPVVVDVVTAEDFGPALWGCVEVMADKGMPLALAVEGTRVLVEIAAGTSVSWRGQKSRRDSLRDLWTQGELAAWGLSFRAWQSWQRLVTGYLGLPLAILAAGGSAGAFCERECVCTGADCQALARAKAVGLIAAEVGPAALPGLGLLGVA